MAPGGMFTKGSFREDVMSKIYNQAGDSVYEIKGGRIVDTYGVCKYVFKDSYICDTSGDKQYEVRGDKVYDFMGNYKGTMDELGEILPEPVKPSDAGSSLENGSSDDHAGLEHLGDVSSKGVDPGIERHGMIIGMIIGGIIGGIGGAMYGSSMNELTYYLIGIPVGIAWGGGVFGSFVTMFKWLWRWMRKIKVGRSDLMTGIYVCALVLCFWIFLIVGPIVTIYRFVKLSKQIKQGY